MRPGGPKVEGTGAEPCTPMAHPTRRPTDAAHSFENSYDPPASLLNQPWIDPHTHAQTLSWRDREQYALAGCHAMVLVASGYHWTPYKPVAAEDIQYLWDDVINRQRAIEREHFFDTGLAVGIHTGVRIDDSDELLDRLREYCRLDSVVAIGETGITPTQHAEQWPLEGQRDVVREQFAIAAENDCPVILHTPAASSTTAELYRAGVGIPGFERNDELTQEPVLDGDNPAIQALEEDIALAREVGFDERQLIASHADANNAELLLEATDCLLSFTLGYPWLTGVTVETVAKFVHEYGPERIMIETDAANVLNTDVLAIKRAIVECYRLGLSVEEIERIVYENPQTALNVGE